MFGFENPFVGFAALCFTIWFLQRLEDTYRFALILGGFVFFLAFFAIEGEQSPLIILGISLLFAILYLPVRYLSKDLKLENEGLAYICLQSSRTINEVRDRYESIYHPNSQVPTRMRLKATAEWFNVSLPDNLKW